MCDEKRSADDVVLSRLQESHNQHEGNMAGRWPSVLLTHGPAREFTARALTWMPLAILKWWRLTPDTGRPTGAVPNPSAKAPAELESIGQHPFRRVQRMGESPLAPSSSTVPTFGGVPAPIPPWTPWLRLQGYEMSRFRPDTIRTPILALGPLRASAAIDIRHDGRQRGARGNRCETIATRRDKATTQRRHPNPPHPARVAPR